jgi:murein DD-endopeptidase MepM/ murein hydrolase activator NlpD
VRPVDQVRLPALFRPPLQPRPVVIVTPLPPPDVTPGTSAGVPAAPPPASPPSPFVTAPALSTEAILAPRPLPPEKPTPAPSLAEPPIPAVNPPHTELGFQWPVHGAILVGYGPGINSTQNDGINIAAPAGTAVVAANDGVVAYAGNELPGFGNLIALKHADGWATAYAHCEPLLVKRGDRVRRGQTIAKVGATGTVGEPQLHFEMRRGTHTLDPVNYLPPASAVAAE